MDTPSFPRVRRAMLGLLGVALAATSSGAARAQWPAEAPFEAWVASESITVVPTSEKQWPSLGLVRYGDHVRVERCEPRCQDPRAWAYLAPFGAVRLSNLRMMPIPAEAGGYGLDFPMAFGRMLRGSSSYETQSREGRVVTRLERGDELVFRDGPDPGPDGFLLRQDGSYVPRADVEMFRPSSFEGWVDPPERFVFVTTDTVVTHDDGTTEPAARYARFPVVRWERGKVRVPAGTIPWNHVRSGRVRRRPARVAEGARWVHVDLGQQVLTAYEGDRMVFATLVSSGRVRGTTTPGTFSVRRKLVYTTMKSSFDEDDTYFVEGVQWVQYFHGAIAFHSAFWHDRFGTPMSHGCVNLSPRDARWLFDFSPGAVPDGWRAVNPQPVYGSALAVRIERQAPR